MCSFWQSFSFFSFHQSHFSQIVPSQFLAQQERPRRRPGNQIYLIANHPVTVIHQELNSGSVNMFKNRIDNYLVRARYTWIRPCGLSISQWLPCPQPSERSLGWQPCYILLFSWTLTVFLLFLLCVHFCKSKLFGQKVAVLFPSMFVAGITHLGTRTLFWSASNSISRSDWSQ